MKMNVCYIKSCDILWLFAFSMQSTGNARNVNLVRSSALSILQQSVTRYFHSNM